MGEQGLLRCPRCGQDIRVKDPGEEKPRKCPSCGHAFTGRAEVTGPFQRPLAAMSDVLIAGFGVLIVGVGAIIVVSCIFGLVASGKEDLAELISVVRCGFGMLAGLLMVFGGWAVTRIPQRGQAGNTREANRAEA